MIQKSICHIITGLETGGAETQLFRLLEDRNHWNYSHRVISLTSVGSIGRSLRNLGYEVHALDTSAGPALIGALLRLRNLIRESPPILLQGWMYHGNLAALAARRWAGAHVPLMWNIRHSLHDLERENVTLRLLLRLSKQLSRQPGRVIYNSEIARNQHQAFGFSALHSQVIANGFDLDKLSFDVGARRRFRSHLDIPEDAPVVGHIGRFHATKNHSGFLKAAVLILRSNPAAHFVMIGKNVHPDNAALKEMMGQLPAERIHRLGYRQDVARLLSTMDVVCSTSWGEAFPNTIGESMACSVPCVVTNVGDCARLVGDTGYVVERGDMTALARAVNRVLRASHSTKRELARSARQRMERCFSIKEIRQQYQEIYDDMITNPS